LVALDFSSLLPRYFPGINPVFQVPFEFQQLGTDRYRARVCRPEATKSRSAE
jgi:hypothetical protein